MELVAWVLVAPYQNQLVREARESGNSVDSMRFSGSFQFPQGVFWFFHLGRTRRHYG